MTDRPTPPYPSPAELKATRARAIVALLVIAVGVVASIVLLTLQIAQVATFSPAIFVGLLLGTPLLVLIIAIAGGRKRPRGSSSTILSTSEQAGVDRVVDRIRSERGQHDER